MSTARELIEQVRSGVSPLTLISEGDEKKPKMGSKEAASKLQDVIGSLGAVIGAVSDDQKKRLSDARQIMDDVKDELEGGKKGDKDD